jgi:biotin carboxyl carrier protein
MVNQVIPIHHNSVLSSPIPGKIVKILVHEGDIVAKGQSVFVVESMKMFHELRVTRNGRMTHIAVKEGDFVLPNHHLAYIL